MGPNKNSKKRAQASLPSRNSLKQQISQNWKIRAKASGHESKRRRISPDASGGLAKGAGAASSKEEVWFDDVSDTEVAEARVSKSGLKGATGEKKAAKKKTKSKLHDKPPKTVDKKSILISGTNTGVTKHIAIDCEMVGVGRDGKDSFLARCSLVNRFGHKLYDEFVQAEERVTDFRTWVSGIRPQDLSKRNAKTFQVVQKEVADLVKGKILVGHAIRNDLKVLLLDHPRKSIRDTSRYKPFRHFSRGRTPGLKLLVKKMLGFQIQTGEHSSVEDAQATMAIFNKVRTEWEQALKGNVGGIYGTNQKTKKKIAAAKAKESTEDADADAQ